MLKRYLLYLVRWQLSTPILALALVYFAKTGKLTSTIIANLIGGLIFFWVDRFIFSAALDKPIWEIRHKAVCADCGKESRGYRLVAAKNYDRRNDPAPEYRCEECSTKKAASIADSGVNLE